MKKLIVIKLVVFLIFTVVLIGSLFSCSRLVKIYKYAQNDRYYEAKKKIFQEATNVALKEIPEDWENRIIGFSYDDQTDIWSIGTNPIRRMENYDESVNSKEVAKNFLFVIYRVIYENEFPISKVSITIDEPVLHNVDITLGINAYKKSPLFTMKHKDDINGETFMKYLYDHVNNSSNLDVKDSCIVFN